MCSRTLSAFNIGESVPDVKKDLCECRKGLTFFMAYDLPKCDRRSVLERADAYCRRQGMELTLGYALRLAGREDADEIYEHSTKFFSYFTETLHSASQFGHNLFYAREHYKDFLFRRESDPDYDSDNVLSDYYEGLWERLDELATTGTKMEFEEIIGSGFRYCRWVYER